MNWRSFLMLHRAVTAFSAGLLWWFVFPSAPGEAVADTITAAATAGYAEVVAMRLGWWT
jgi:hypothetical protein